MFPWSISWLLWMTVLIYFWVFHIFIGLYIKHKFVIKYCLRYHPDVFNSRSASVFSWPFFFWGWNHLVCSIGEFAGVTIIITWIKTFGFARLLLIVWIFLWFEHICRNCFLIYGLWYCTSDRVLKTVLAHSTWSSELKGKAFVHYAGTYSMFVWAYLAIGVSYSSHHYFADSLVTDMIISMHYWIL